MTFSIRNIRLVPIIAKRFSKKAPTVNLSKKLLILADRIPDFLCSNVYYSNLIECCSVMWPQVLSLRNLQFQCLLFVVCLNFCPATSKASLSLSLRPHNSQQLYTAASTVPYVLREFMRNPNSPAKFACHGYKHFFGGMMRAGQTVLISCVTCTNDTKWLDLRRFLDLRTLSF